MPLCTRNIRFVAEYDGAQFHGWQLQPGLHTVQGSVSEVLSRCLRQPIGALHCAGRTDAGVHARGQVVNFSLEGPAERTLDLSRLALSVSELLRGTVTLPYMDEVAPMFHARTSAIAKQYSYQMVLSSRPLVLDRLRCWGVPPRLDVSRMIHEAQTLVGVHDLKSFQASDCRAQDTVREIFESELTFSPPYLTYRVVGAGFLKQAVRTIVGTLVEIGLGKKGSETIASILAARDRTHAGMTAPAHGLCLDWVHYPEPYTLPEPFCWRQDSSAN